MMYKARSNKKSNIHFVATKKYKPRVIQMGNKTQKTYGSYDKLDSNGFVKWNKFDI